MKNKLIIACLLSLLALPVKADLNVNFRDTPLKDAITSVLESEKVQYQLNADIQGRVTARLRDQSLDSTLKLLLRNAVNPLVVRKENGVYIIENRPKPVDNTRLFDIKDLQDPVVKSVYFTIPLTYIDSRDLSSLIGPILEVNHFTRQRR